MEWKNREITEIMLKITKKDKNGKIIEWYQMYGDSLDPQLYRHLIEVDLTDDVREIQVMPHTFEHYSLTLKQECVAGTLGIHSDTLRIEIIDSKEIYYIQRRISNSADDDENFKESEDRFIFEKNTLISYEGDKTKNYQIIKHEMITKELSDLTNGIPNDRTSVINPDLEIHYEAFKQLRPEIAESLEACLNELRR